MDKSAPTPAAADRSPTPRKGSNLRLVILLVVLAVLGAAGAWDYLVARPGYEKAVSQLDEVLPPDGASLESIAAFQSRQVDQTEIRQLIGREPSETTQHGSFEVDRYSWRRGIPFLTYDLFVIYAGEEKKLLSEATTDREQFELWVAPGAAAPQASRAAAGAPENDRPEIGDADSPEPAPASPEETQP